MDNINNNISVSLDNPTFAGVISLLNLIVSQYFQKDYGTCLITDSSDGEDFPFIDSPLSSIRINLPDDSSDSTFLNSIENGCQSFILAQSVSLGFLDRFRYLHDRTIQRFSGKKMIILLGNNLSTTYIEDIVLHKAVHDIPNLLFLQPIDPDRIDLITHRFTSRNQSHELIVLDRFIPSRREFLLVNDLFPDKLKNLEGRFLRLAVFNYLPYTIWREVGPSFEPNVYLDQQPTLHLDGTESRIFLEFCAKFNCSLDISLDEEMEWGEIFDNRTGNGIIGAVVEHRADIGVGALYSWHHESIYLTLSKPISRTGVTCIAPNPRLLSSWLIPVLPFSTNLWIAVATTFFVMSFFSLVLNYLVQKVLFQQNHRMDICGSFMTIGSIFILQTVLLRINQNKYTSQMVAMGSLLFVGLMIGNVYSGGLSSIMTIPRTEPPIDTLHDLADSGIPWASTHDAWIFSILMATQPVILKLLHNFQTHPKEVLHDFTREHNLAYSVERLPYGHFAIGEYIDEEASKDFRLMKEDIYWENCVAMSTKTWPMMEQLDQLILVIFQSGIQRYWEQEVVSIYENGKIQRAIATSRHRENSGPITLQPAHLLGAFLILAFGLAAALLAFLSEMAVWKMFGCRGNKVSQFDEIY